MLGSSPAHVTIQLWRGPRTTTNYLIGLGHDRILNDLYRLPCLRRFSCRAGVLVYLCCSGRCSRILCTGGPILPLSNTRLCRRQLQSAEEKPTRENDDGASAAVTSPPAGCQPGVSRQHVSQNTGQGGTRTAQRDCSSSTKGRLHLEERRMSPHLWLRHLWFSS